MLSDLHAETLSSLGIDLDLAASIGVRSINSLHDLRTYAPDLVHHGRNAQGILFPWRNLANPDHVVTHIRVDHPLLQSDNSVQRYICPAGSGQVIARLRPAQSPGSPILLIEGFKQALAAASAIESIDPDADDDLVFLRDFGVCSIQGCWGTSTADISPLANREVYVIFDADFSTKTAVYDAAKRTMEQLNMIGCDARFIKLPASQKDGLDDVLGRMPQPLRATALHNLIATGTTRLGRRPAARNDRHLNPVPENHVPDDSQPTPNPSTNSGFTLGKPPVSAVVDQLLPSCLLAGDPESSSDIVMYSESGVYRPLLKNLAEEITSRLMGPDEYNPTDTTKVLTALADALRSSDRTCPEFLVRPLLNTPNAILDLATLETFDHDPAIPSLIQFRTPYIPDATCPTFDAWLDEVLPDPHAQRVLLEHAAQVLDPTSIPARHLMLEGPPGTGKSTFLRTMHALIGGTENGRPRDHQLVESLPLEVIANSQDRFAIGNLQGKIVNLAGDLAFSQFPDLAMWKQLTGEDYISADRKNSTRVRFRCRALFIFGMNQFPQVSDAGYFRRVTPVHFGVRIGERIDKTLESRLHSELPGILNRLIRSWQDTNNRGRLLLADSSTTTRFQGETDPIRKWFYSADNPFPEGVHEASEVYRSYCTSCSAEGEIPEKGIVFGRRVIAIEGVSSKRKRVGRKQVRAYQFPHRTILEQQFEDPDDDGPTPPPPPPAPEPEPTVPPTPAPAASSDPEPVLRESTQVGHPLVFDLETGSVEKVFTTEPTEFIRLFGWASNRTESIEPPTTHDFDTFEPVFRGASKLIGQNITGFDLIAMHKLGWIDLQDIIDGTPGTPQILDTKVMGIHEDPPHAKMSEAAFHKKYSLATQAERFGLTPDKDRLKELAKQHGGFDKIPQDDPTYIAYLQDDIRLTSKVFGFLNGSLAGRTDQSKAYLAREQRVTAIASLMRIGGFRVDQALLNQRLAVLAERRGIMLRHLQADYGLPTEGKAPHSSAAGKAALITALKDHGAKDEDFLMTDKGSIALSGDSMNNIIDQNPGNTQLAELCGTIAELQGQRSVYGTVAEYLHPDGYVHPEVSFRQASGRWSITKPGMSVFGKHTHLEEREIFLPDPGHVLISADFAQVDARCVAALSQDPTYMDMFEPGRDLHTEVAVAIFGDASKRQLAKVVSHGWNYGGSPAGISYATGVDIEAAQEYDRSATERFPGVVSWRAGLFNQVIAGQLLDNGWGRPLKCDWSRARTQSAGLVGQSCARDIAMEALLRMPREVRACMKAFVHDEVVMSFPSDKVEEYTALMLEAMTFEWNGIQFMADASKPGVNWADCYGKG